MSSDVGGALAGVTAGQQQIIDALQQIPPATQQPFAEAPSAGDIAAAVGPAVAASLVDSGVLDRPAGARTASATTARAVRSAAARPGVFTQTTGTRAGRQYVVQGGTRLYESKPGKGDWGKAPNTRIPIAGKAAPKPKPAPKPRAPAPRRPAAHPSRPPAHHAAPPARKPKPKTAARHR
jgi:hypothetical protein